MVTQSFASRGKRMHEPLRGRQSFGSPNFNYPGDHLDHLTSPVKFSPTSATKVAKEILFDPTRRISQLVTAIYRDIDAGQS